MFPFKLGPMGFNHIFVVNGKWSIFLFSSVYFSLRCVGLIRVFSCLSWAPDYTSLVCEWQFIILCFLAAGNLRHLIVEACIARHLLDTSAYFWHGYVSTPFNQLPHSIPNHLPSWSSLMKGSPLTPPLVNVLVATPASRYAAMSCIIFCFHTLHVRCESCYFHMAKQQWQN